MRDSFSLFVSRVLVKLSQHELSVRKINRLTTALRQHRQVLTTVDTDFIFNSSVVVIYSLLIVKTNEKYENGHKSNLLEICYCCCFPFYVILLLLCISDEEHFRCTSSIDLSDNELLCMANPIIL